MVRSRDVIVVGGGVIGTSIAFHLAKAGIETLLLERGPMGGEASNAASGALFSEPGFNLFSKFGKESLTLLCELSGELKELGGVDIELVQCGELDLALSEKEAHDLQDYARRFSQIGGKAQWLDQQEVLEMEPEIAPSIYGAAYFPEFCRVNNQRLSDAFARAGTRLGAEFRQGVEVAGLITEGDRLTGVRLQDEDLYSDTVVLAAGAWSKMLADHVDVNVPTRPVRGQNINIQPVNRGIRTIVTGSWGLLVPRNDGSVMIGATVEEVGFDSRVTAGGMGSILGVATQLVPAFKTASINWAVAGLRPGSPDDLPLIGPVSGCDGLIVAAGHYRRGIMLSAATGRAVARMIQGEKVELYNRLDPNRFNNL